MATYGHDALNRLISATYQIGGATDQTITYSFDAGTNGKGLLTGASDANHSISWTYDALGRVTGKGQTVAGVTKSVGYAYVSADLTTLTTPSGQTVTYSYANHQITGIAVNSTAVLTSATYEPFGPVRGWTWGNGTTEVRLHNTDGNANMISGIESVSLGYDNAFRITSASNSSNSTLSWNYGYDLLDRVTSASESGTTLGWSYDPNGNRMQQTGATAATALSMAGTSFAYNGRGRMVSATAGSTTTSYVYNALGQMIEKNVGGTVTLLMYDEIGHLLGEYSSAGSLIQETVWLGNIPVATLRPNGSTVSIYYVHANQLGAPIMVSRSADNAIMWRWDSDPFGTVVPNQNPQSLGTFIYNLRFPGQYYQAETGLNYNYHRDYDAAAGRYRQSDPLGLRGGSFSTYAYVRGNPITLWDFFGLSANDLSPIVVTATFINAASSPAQDAVPMTDLYRAVTPAELQSIQDLQAFSNPYGIESKYFSTTPAGAQSYASQAEAAYGDDPYTIVKSSIPTSEITPDMIVPGGVDGGIPTVVVPTETLPSLTEPIIVELP